MNVGKSFNARTLAKGLEVTQPAISKALPSLKKEKILLVKKDKESKQLKIELDINNPKLIGLKRADNLRLIYESGLEEFLEENFPGTTIILFGSYANGDDYYNSDIDIAIVGSKSKDADLSKFEKILEKEIRINFYKSLKDIHKDLRDNILRGIILVGGIEL
jgi:predicted nucleotidyltransferase